MRIALISGSHRQQSQSAKVARYLAARLPALDSETATDLIDLAGNPLPLWDESGWQADSALSKQWKPYGERLSAADGFVVISPEWHGMVPPGLKNFLLFASGREVGNKPALIVGVSSSRGGTYPVSELRLDGGKNNRLCFIPEHLIVRDVETMFGGETPSGKDDEYIRGRADFALGVLLAYTKALKPMRESAKLFDKAYAFGM